MKRKRIRPGGQRRTKKRKVEKVFVPIMRYEWGSEGHHWRWHEFIHFEIIFFQKNTNLFETIKNFIKKFNENPKHKDESEMKYIYSVHEKWEFKENEVPTDLKILKWILKETDEIRDSGSTEARRFDINNETKIPKIDKDEVLEYLKGEDEEDIDFLWETIWENSDII
jgi:hypothetical protein